MASSQKFIARNRAPRVQIAPMTSTANELVTLAVLAAGGMVG